jgi:hypothetical protein
MASNRTSFDQLVDRFEPEVRNAFLGAFDRIKANVDAKLLKQIVAELERGDIEAVIDLLGIDRAAFGGLEIAIADAFNRGGIIMAGDLGLKNPAGGKVSITFGVRNLVAEAILREFSAAEVTGITEAQIASLRIALAEGLARGDNPTRTALDMVGRVSRLTGKREGGYLGLSGPQERTRANALSTMISGDREGMRAYLALKQRDIRFDAMVRKALAQGWDQVVIDFNKRTKGKPITARDLQNRIIGRLNDRQLKFRADKLALHETFTALSMAKNEAMRQAIESGKVDLRFVLKKWKHSGKEHARFDHKRLHNTEVGFAESFVMGDGTMLAFPHAPGAPARHVLGCGCWFELKIDYTGQFIARRAA